MQPLYLSALMYFSVESYFNGSQGNFIRGAHVSMLDSRNVDVISLLLFLPTPALRTGTRYISDSVEARVGVADDELLDGIKDGLLLCIVA